jgi:WhiB family transcriptional regulator, redox-sensing transcriptional regulator
MTRARMPRPHEVAAARRDPRLLRALQERDSDLTWRARGVCQSVDPEVFFPAPSEPADAAIALCRTCEVQGACLAWALEVGDCHGVWGATTPRERRAMLVAWRSDDGSPRRGDEAMLRGDEAMLRGDEAMLRGDDAIMRGDDTMLRRDDAMMRGDDGRGRLGPLGEPPAFSGVGMGLAASP